MIVVCEPVCWGSEHVPFNAGVLEIIRAGFPDEELFFFGEQTHIEQVQRQLSQPIIASVFWMPIVIPGRRVGYLHRFLHEIKIIRNLLNILSQSSKGNLLFTCVTPSTLTTLKLFQGLTRRNVCVQVVLHEVANGLSRRRSRHPIRRLQDIKTAIRVLGRSNVQYLVLEESIREAILKSVPSLSGRVEVLEHSLPPNEGGSQIGDLSMPIRFGFLGLANEQKGFPIFVRLAAEMTRRYRGQVEFHAIGFTNKKDSIQEMDVLTTKPNVGWLSRSDFIEGVKQLHFVVLPYQLPHYSLTASAVLLDAIAWGKPIIARKIPIFDDMFKRYGDIGYLFNYDKELTEIVENIMKEANRSHYRMQVLNIRNVRAAKTPTVLATTYREIRDKAMSQR
jgi:glycosyltransferase involved in cell wall biosynthesis